MRLPRDAPSAKRASVAGARSTATARPTGGRLAQKVAEPPDPAATRLAPSPLTGGAILLRLVSPDGWNRLTLDLLREIAAQPQAYPHARGFVLTGSEQAFSAGADLNAIAALTPAAAWSLARAGQEALNVIARAPVPFIAAIDGYCLGGGLDLALACRARLATPRAYLGHHGAKLGLVTGWAGTQRLPPLLGSAPTLAQLLPAHGWSAQDALTEGLISAITPPETLLTRAAQAILRAAP
jgi:enoyl-CoA hydratase